MGKSGKQFRDKENRRDRNRNNKRKWLQNDSTQQQPKRHPDKGEDGNGRKAA